MVQKIAIAGRIPAGTPAAAAFERTRAALVEKRRRACVALCALVDDWIHSKQTRAQLHAGTVVEQLETIALVDRILDSVPNPTTLAPDTLAKFPAFPAPESGYPGDDEGRFFMFAVPIFKLDLARSDSQIHEDVKARFPERIEPIAKGGLTWDVSPDRAFGIVLFNAQPIARLVHEPRAAFEHPAITDEPPDDDDPPVEAAFQRAREILEDRQRRLRVALCALAVDFDTGSKGYDGTAVEARLAELNLIGRILGQLPVPPLHVRETIAFARVADPADMDRAQYDPRRHFAQPADPAVAARNAMEERVPAPKYPTWSGTDMDRLGGAYWCENHAPHYWALVRADGMCIATVYDHAARGTSWSAVWPEADEHMNDDEEPSTDAAKSAAVAWLLNVATATPATVRPSGDEAPLDRIVNREPVGDE